MSNIVDNPFVFVDPAERATTKEKVKAFEWLRGVAIKDIGSPESESAAIMMLEVIRLNQKQLAQVPIHIRKQPVEAVRGMLLNDEGHE